MCLMYFFFVKISCFHQKTTHLWSEDRMQSENEVNLAWSSGLFLSSLICKVLHSALYNAFNYKKIQTKRTPSWVSFHRLHQHHIDSVNLSTEERENHWFLSESEGFYEGTVPCIVAYTFQSWQTLNKYNKGLWCVNLDVLTFFLWFSLFLEDGMSSFRF